MEDKRPRTAKRKKSSIPGQLKLKESAIQRMILEWLLQRGIFCWYVKTVGTFDSKIGGFRRPPWYYRKGVPDIHGFIEGIPFVIEVKSATGRLSPEQIKFRNDFLRNALEGIHIVARSVEDVERAFVAHDLNI